MNQGQAQWNLDAARAVIHALVAEGVRCVVLSPGSRNTPLTLAFSERDDVESLVVIDERSAGFIALGRARASGSAVALVCTSGSAGSHYLPAFIEADASGIPLIALTADRPWELQQSGAPQTMDQRELFGRFVRASRDIPAPDGPIESQGYRQAARRIHMASMGVRPGPVHLNMAFREPLWHPSIEMKRTSGSQLSEETTSTPQVTQAHWPDIERIVMNAKRGVVVCGPMSGMRSEFGQTVVAMAEALQWPLLAETGSGARHCGHARTRIEHYDALLRSNFAHVVEPDCIIQFGQACLSKALAGWVAKHNGQASLITVGQGQICDPNGADTHLVEAVPETFAQRVVQSSLNAVGNEAWLNQWKRADGIASAALAPFSEMTDWEGGVAHACIDALPDGGSLHIANSMPIRDVNGFAQSGDRTLRIWTNRGINGIDGTLATAAGEASAQPNTPFAVLVGDLAFLHDMSSLISIAKSSMTIVVVDNSGGGIFEFLPISGQSEVFESCFATPQNVDLSGLCSAVGVDYLDVENPKELSDILRREFERDGASVIRVRIDRKHNKRIHEQAWSMVEHAVKACP